MQQNVLINKTLSIINTPIDPRIYNKVATSRASTINLATPCTTEVITDAACSNVWALRNPGLVSRAVRDGGTPGHCDISVRSPWLKSPVLIGTTVSPTITGSQDIFRLHRYTSSMEVRNSQVFNTSIHGNSSGDEDSTPIFGKLIRG